MYIKSDCIFILSSPLSSSTLLFQVNVGFPSLWFIFGSELSAIVFADVHVRAFYDRVECNNTNEPGIKVFAFEMAK